MACDRGLALASRRIPYLDSPVRRQRKAFHHRLTMLLTKLRLWLLDRGLALASPEIPYFDGLIVEAEASPLPSFDHATD